MNDDGNVAVAAVEGARTVLRTLQLGEEVRQGALTITPLLPPAPPTGPPAYELLRDALAGGAAEVGEIGADGRVPTLSLRNGSTRPILVPEGAILIGAKQNRMIDVTLLVPAGETPIPVSCVEQGRWRSVSATFAAGGFAAAGVRKGKLEAMLEREDRRASKQARVWEEVAELNLSLGVHSPTGDLGAAYGRLDDEPEGETRSWDLPEGAVGAVVTAFGAVLGLDVFGHPATAKAIWPEVVRGYRLDGLRRQAAPEPSWRPDVEAWLERIAEGLAADESRPGLGVGLVVQAAGATGGGLWHQGDLLHLAAFPV